MTHQLDRLKCQSSQPVLFSRQWYCLLSCASDGPVLVQGLRALISQINVVWVDNLLGKLLVLSVS